MTRCGLDPWCWGAVLHAALLSWNLWQSLWLGTERGFPGTRSQCFVLVQEHLYVYSRKKKHPPPFSPLPVSHLFLSLLIRIKKLKYRKANSCWNILRVQCPALVSADKIQKKRSCKLVLGWGGLGWVAQGFGQWDHPLSLWPPPLSVGPTETAQCSVWGAPWPPAHSCEMWRTVLDVPLLNQPKRFRCLQGPHLPHHTPLSVQKILPKHTCPFPLHSPPASSVSYLGSHFSACLRGQPAQGLFVSKLSISIRFWGKK